MGQSKFEALAKKLKSENLKEHWAQTLKAQKERYVKPMEIAQVKSKAIAEVVALQNTLHKKQIKIQLLEGGIEQEVQENDELIKICNDLIAKM